jgi:hypothetical protein
MPSCTRPFAAVLCSTHTGVRTSSKPLDNLSVSRTQCMPSTQCGQHTLLPWGGGGGFSPKLGRTP